MRVCDEAIRSVLLKKLLKWLFELGCCHVELVPHFDCCGEVLAFKSLRQSYFFGREWNEEDLDL